MGKYRFGDLIKLKDGRTGRIIETYAKADDVYYVVYFDPKSYDIINENDIYTIL